MAVDSVLLVDDEVEFVETLAERMRSRGLHVDTAHDGAAALEAVERRRYDAVVLDLAMPGMDGLETLRKIRAANPDQQVILLTGQGTIQAAVEATREGAMEFLEKPTDIGALLDKIRTARARRLAADQARTQAEIEAILARRGW